MAIKAKGDQTNYYLEIDLKKDMGIDRNLNPLTKREVGQAIIDVIIERTRGQGRPLTGGSFAPYSEQYAKIKGVSVNDVDLTLFGDMLNSLQVGEISGDKLIINSDDSFQYPKLFNHNTGDTVPKREFFGILKSEINNVKKSLQAAIDSSSGADAEMDRQRREEEEFRQRAIERLADSIVRGIEFE